MPIAQRFYRLRNRKRSTIIANVFINITIVVVVVCRMYIMATSAMRQ